MVSALYMTSRKVEVLDRQLGYKDDRVFTLYPYPMMRLVTLDLSKNKVLAAHLHRRPTCICGSTTIQSGPAPSPRPSDCYLVEVLHNNAAD